MDYNYDDEFILGLTRKELMDFINLKDDTEESIIDALYTQISRLVDYVTEELLDSKKEAIKEIKFYFADSFYVYMSYLFSEEYFTIKELFMLDTITLLLKFLNIAKEDLDYEYSGKSELYKSYSFQDPYDTMMKLIINIKDVLFDTIYFDIDADYDFDTNKNPYSDIIFNIEALVHLSGYNSFVDFAERYKSNVIDHFDKLYNMENKLKSGEEPVDKKEYVKYKIGQHRKDIIELIINEMLMSDANYAW